LNRKKLFFIFFVLLSLFVILNFGEAQSCTSNSFAKINVWNNSETNLDNSAYVVKNSNSDFIALFKNNGYLYLKGICVSNPTCNPPSNSFVIKNLISEVVSYIDSNGNLCIESGDCSSISASCNPTTGAFLVKNLAGTIVSYIDYTGDLCLTGSLNSEKSIGKQYLLNLLQQSIHNGKIVKFESVANDNSIVVSVDGTMSNSLAKGAMQLISGLNIRNVDSNCILVTQCSDGTDNDNDGAIDYPNDFSCSSTTDNDETNPKAQCQDGLDNDGDGKIDLQDPGCTSKQDNDEVDFIPPGTTQCSDGADNDGDGKIDLQDPGCNDANDNDETDPSTGSGPDTGGGGGTSNTKTWSRVKVNELKEFLPSVIKVTRIAFKLNEETRDVRLKVKKFSPSSSISKPDGEVYQYFEIDFNVERSKFVMSKIEFEVDKEWINRKSLTKNDIKLMKYSGGSWIDLTTNIFSETNTRINYEVPDAKGFSDFAIVGKQSTGVTPAVNPCGNGVINNNEDCSNCPSDVRCRSDESCNYGVCTRRQVQLPEGNICGNGIRDAGEDCRTCPTDVRCASGEYCSAGVCVEEKKEPEFNIMDYIWILIIGILILAGLIIAAVIYIRASKKTVEHKLKNVDNRKIDRLKSLIEEQVAQGYTKEQIRISALRASWPKDMIEEVLRNVK